jgi:micrococcal nuclease
VILAAIMLALAPAVGCAQDPPDRPAASDDLRVPDGAAYVASSRGRVFYWVGCTAWTSLSPANLRFFPTRAAALAAGYTPSRSAGCAPEVASGGAPALDRIDRCTIARITDGDTVVCEGGERVRLLLVDAPESRQQDYGLRAKLALEEMAPAGTSLRLEMDVQPRDRYGRVLAHLYAGELWINREMVRRGYALVSVYPPNVEGIEQIRAAADSARAEAVGLWREGGFDCAPARFRRGRCGHDP